MPSHNTIPATDSQNLSHLSISHFVHQTGILVVLGDFSLSLFSSGTPPKAIPEILIFLTIRENASSKKRQKDVKITLRGINYSHYKFY